MNRVLARRLNQVFGRVTNPEFLASKGLANEIAYHIFDYPARDEKQLREHLPKLWKELERHQPPIHFQHFDLYEEMLNYLDHRNLLHRVLDIDQVQTDTEVLKKVRSAVNEEKLTRYLSEHYDLEAQQLIFLSGAGKVRPVIRCSALLTRLHSLTGKTPVVLFFPGDYDGASFRIFGETGESSDSNYYRAFRLITEG